MKRSDAENFMDVLDDWIEARRTGNEDLIKALKETCILWLTEDGSHD